MRCRSPSTTTSASRSDRPSWRLATSNVDPSMTVPAAIIYDHTLSDADSSQLALCPDFEKALEAGADGPDLESHACFQGDCRHQDDFSIMCPSGFWGYRHFVGVPASLSP